MINRKILLAGVIAASVMLVGCNDTISVEPKAIDLAVVVCDDNDGVHQYTLHETSTFTYVYVTCINNAYFSRVVLYNSATTPEYSDNYKYLTDKKQE